MSSRRTSTSRSTTLLDFEFDWWLTNTCMPAADEFEAEIAAASGTGSWLWDPITIHDATANASSPGYLAERLEAQERADEFHSWAECYNSTWWGEAEPVAPGGIMSEIGQKSAAHQQIAVALGEGKGLSPKMLFCLCATRSTDMVDGATGFFDVARWWAVGGALFFALTLVATWCLMCPASKRGRKYNPRFAPEFSSYTNRRAL